MKTRIIASVSISIVLLIYAITIIHLSFVTLPVDYGDLLIAFGWSFFLVVLTVLMNGLIWGVDYYHNKNKV